jgi:hypothetical protein
MVYLQAASDRWLLGCRASRTALEDGMKRALAAVVVLLLGGCGSDPATVDVYWDFVRHAQGGSVRYSTTLVHPGVVAGACEQAGVDEVAIADEAGQLLAQVPCIHEGYQAVRLLDAPRGKRSWTIVGYRGTFETGQVATYLEAFEIDVRPGFNEILVGVQGLPDDLDLFAQFVDASGTQQIAATCAEAGVATLDYALVDAVGTLVASGAIPCADPAGVRFLVSDGTGIDRDLYTVRLRAFPPGSSLAAFDSAQPENATQCVLPQIDHLGSDLDANGFLIRMFTVLPSTRCGD